MVAVDDVILVVLAHEVDRDVLFVVAAGLDALETVELGLVAAVEVPQRALDMGARLGDNRRVPRGIELEDMVFERRDANVFRIGAARCHLVEIQIRTVCEVKPR